MTEKWSMEKVVDFVDNLKLGISSVVFCKILKLKVMTEMRCHGLVFELPEKNSLMFWAILMILAKDYVKNLFCMHLHTFVSQNCYFFRQQINREI